MDLTTIAAAAGVALVPYLVKGGEKLAEKAAEEGFEQRHKIWGLVKGLFTEDDMITLNLFEQEPSDARIQGRFEMKLEDKLRENQEVAKELEQLLSAIPNVTKTNFINNSGNDS